MRWDRLRFRVSCQRGYQGAVELAAFCSRLSITGVKTYYEQSCQAGWFDRTRSHAPGLDESLEDENLGEELARGMWLGLLMSFGILIY